MTAARSEWIQRVLRGEAPFAAAANLVGYALVDVGDGAGTMELAADARHGNPMGTLSGGMICELSDAAMGTAMATTLADDESFTTIELKANFLKPIRAGKVRATARVVKRTRTLGLIECDVVDEKGSLVARSSSTCMVLRGEAAAGR